MLQFISENYVWFIVGGIVLIMVIIGYFAEKTEFGSKAIEKKEKKPKKDKETAKKEEIEKALLENDVNKGLGDLTLENAELSNLNEDLNAPFGDENSGNEMLNGVESNEDLSVPFGDNGVSDVTVPVTEEPIEEPQMTEFPIEEPIEEPQMTEFPIEEPIEQNETEPIIEEPIQAPVEEQNEEEKNENINDLFEEPIEEKVTSEEVEQKPSDSEDDVWNF